MLEFVQLREDWAVEQAGRQEGAELEQINLGGRAARGQQKGKREEPGRFGQRSEMAND